MAPRRRPIYPDENSSSDEFSDSLYQPLQRHRQSKMADETPQEAVKRRGRGPSKRPCLNRNAQMARENRQKKKEYVQRIENKLSQLQNENKNLSTVIQQQNIDIKKLNADVSYLKSVLNNKSSITMLLKSMNQNLQKFRRKAEQETLPIINRKDAFSDLEPLDSKFCEDYKIKLEDGAQITNNESYQILAEAYRMNNNISKNDEDQIFGNSKHEDDVKMKNLLPVTPVSLDGKNNALDEMDLNEFSNLGSSNIFDDLTQLDETYNTMDFGQDTCSMLDENFFQSLDDSTGVCLHVNPSRVSLEFCSSCQKNSANSVLE